VFDKMKKRKKERSFFKTGVEKNYFIKKGGGVCIKMREMIK
jgi:hypothetical protein